MRRGASYRIGVDIGGTFTDVVLLGGDALRRKKVLSTPDDYARGVVEAVVGMLAEHGIAPAEVDGIVHATTVASNAVLEFKGARTALVTTEGFRDVLEMRRLRIPVLYDLQYRKPAPLVPRRRRYEIPGRIGPTGAIWRPLDEDAVRRVAATIAADGAEAVAVSLLHAYANPEHERRTAELLRDAVGDHVFVTCSSEILPEIREYERTSTTVVNAYLGPTVSGYLRSLVSGLRQAGVTAPLRVMQSGGGLMSPDAAMLKPAGLLESGPAAGVVACAHLAEATETGDVISLDMGGTTAKAALLEGGRPLKTNEYEVGAGINLSSKLVTGGGYPVRLPFIDISEIGAGGGSIVTVDEFGILTVGPESAGSNPGPVCYGLGGAACTLTDALVTLGYLGPASLAGGTVPLDADAARAAVQAQVAEPLGKSLLDAAHGVFEIAIATMTRAVKAVTTYRGRDPRDFLLAAFGGNGPVAAAAIARVLGIPRVVVPVAPGVFSAAGLLYSDVEHEVGRTSFLRGERLSGAVLERDYAALEADVRAALVAEGHASDRIELARFAEMRYSGQAYELAVSVPAGAVDVDGLVAGFHREHERTYGHVAADDPVDVVSVRVVARVPSPRNGASSPRAGEPNGARPARRAWFGAPGEPVDVPVLARAALAGRTVQGPLFIDEYDATCVVPPDCRAHVDEHGSIVIDVAGEAR